MFGRVWLDEGRVRECVHYSVLKCCGSSLGRNSVTDLILGGNSVTGLSLGLGRGSFGSGVVFELILNLVKRTGARIVLSRGIFLDLFLSGFRNDVSPEVRIPFRVSVNSVLGCSNSCQEKNNRVVAVSAHVTVIAGPTEAEAVSMGSVYLVVAVLAAGEWVSDQVVGVPCQLDPSSYINHSVHVCIVGVVVIGSSDFV